MTIGKRKHLKVPLKEMLKNSELGYMMGVIFGDAYLNRRTIVLICVDKDFALKFKKSIESVFKLKANFQVRKNNSYKQGFYYKIIFYSIKAVLILKQLKVYFLNYKIQKEMARKFIRGFVDSEGNVGLREIRISNTNFGLLKYVQKLLKKFSIFSKIREANKPQKLRYKQPYGLFISKYQNIKLFYKEIGFGILRKENKLKSMLSQYHTTPKDKYNKIIKMRKKGLIYKKIREEVNIPESTIYSWCNKIRKPILE